MDDTDPLFGFTAHRGRLFARRPVRRRPATVPGRRPRLREVNGEPALVVQTADQLVVIAPEVLDGRITVMRSVVNPEKLRYLRHQLSRSSEPSSPT